MSTMHRPHRLASLIGLLAVVATAAGGAAQTTRPAAAQDAKPTASRAAGTTAATRTDAAATRESAASRADTASTRAAASAASAAISSGDPAIDAILDRLETRGAAVKDLRARVRKEQIETFPVEESQTEEGVILFRQMTPNPKFLVRFDSYAAAGIRRDDKSWYLFDGEWLIERRDATKNVVKRQIVTAGERIDVFKLGKGPFPLPFGQSRRDMLTNFTIARAAAKPDDPPNTDHLVCTSRKDTEIARQFRVVDFFIDRKLELPTRIVAERTADGILQRVDFTGIELNVGLAASEFSVVIPKEYNVSVEPLAPGNAPRSPLQ